MVPGAGTFDAVLDLVGEQRAGLRARGSWSGIRGLNVGFVGAASGPDGRRHGAPLGADFYGDDADLFAPPDMAAKPETPVLEVSIFKRLSREEVAADIGLLPSDTPAELRLKRRDFARANHPDRIPEEWREAATTRMKIANLLIDEALRKAGSGRP